MPRNPDGERAMTDAERQARYRAARAGGKPVVRTRRPIDHRSRARRWRDIVSELIDLQAQYAAWLEALPDNQKRAPWLKRCRPFPTSTSKSCKPSFRRAASAATEPTAALLGGAR